MLQQITNGGLEPRGGWVGCNTMEVPYYLKMLQQARVGCNTMEILLYYLKMLQHTHRPGGLQHGEGSTILFENVATDNEWGAGA